MMKKLSKGEWVAVAVAVGFVAYTLYGSNVSGLFTRGMSDNNLANVNESINMPDNVIVSDTKLGDGAEVEVGKTLKVHYRLSLSDGTLIQDSRDIGIPFEFIFGAGQVIPGWEMGLQGMKVGGQRTITIPSSLGYGEAGFGPIPPNATLIFDIELLGAEDGGATPTAN